MNNQILFEQSKTVKNEHELQTICVKWFCLNYPNELIFAIPNGGLRNIKVATKLKKEGVVSGIPDLFIAAPNTNKNGLFIEMKFGKNKSTSNQIELCKQLMFKNYYVAECNSLEFFELIVKMYFSQI